MFYKLVEREANNHLNVPIVSSVCVCGLFYKQLSLLVMERQVCKAGKQSCWDLAILPGTLELACMILFQRSAFFIYFFILL